MNDEAGEVRRLLGPLRDRPVSVDQERLAARRARVVSVLEREVQALATNRALRRRRRAGYAALAFTAAAGVLFGVHRLTQHAAPQPRLAITFVGSVGQTIDRSQLGARVLHTGQALQADAGDIESAAEGSAELVSSAGLALRLGGATRVSLAGLATVNQVQLRQGFLTCDVPHLNEGQHFSVQTPDARVVVHGTVFSVRVDVTRAHGAQTCVQVTDGVVIVQHDGSETALNTGDRWGCDSSSPAAPAVYAPLASAGAPVAEPARVGSEHHGKARASARLAEHGTLGEESRLLQEALAAERVGQPERAQSLLEQLLARYPNSALSAEARRAATRIASASAGK